MKLKGIKPVEEYEDKRKWQGPPDRETAEALANSKAWAEYIQQREDAKKRARDQYATRSKSKNGGEYGAKMKAYDKRSKQIDDEDSQSAKDAVKAWENQKPTPEFKKVLKEISDFSRQSFKKAKPLTKKKEPLSYSSGGKVRGYGKARGGKGCKVY